jgi:quinol---cytochrome c reductase cytochrome b subunit, bacillus type
VRCEVWDQLSQWAVTVGTNLVGYTPVFGSQVRFVLIGGVEIGDDTLLRWCVLHVLMLPFVIGRGTAKDLPLVQWVCRE